MLIGFESHETFGKTSCELPTDCEHENVPVGFEGNTSDVQGLAGP